MKKETLNEELRDLSPTLHAHLHKRGNGGMNVPEGYFDGLEDRIFQRLEQEGALRSPAPAPMRVWFSRRTLLAAAASVAMLIVAGLWWMQRQPDEPVLAKVEKPELSAEEVESYVLKNILEFETEQLASLAPSEIPSKTHQNEYAQPGKREKRTATPDFSEEELENILLEMSDEELESLLL